MNSAVNASASTKKRPNDGNEPIELAEVAHDAKPSSPAKTMGTEEDAHEKTNDNDRGRSNTNFKKRIPIDGDGPTS